MTSKSNVVIKFISGEELLKKSTLPKSPSLLRMHPIPEEPKDYQYFVTFKKNILQLLVECFSPEDSSKFTDEIFVGDHVLLLSAHIKNRDTPDGMLMFVPIDNNSALLYNVCVRKKFRRCCIMTQILCSFLPYLKKNGFKIIYVKVNIENEGGQKFWQKIGFESQGVSKTDPNHLVYILNLVAKPDIPTVNPALQEMKNVETVVSQEHRSKDVDRDRDRDRDRERELDIDKERLVEKDRESVEKDMESDRDRERERERLEKERERLEKEREREQESDRDRDGERERERERERDRERLEKEREREPDLDREQEWERLLERERERLLERERERLLEKERERLLEKDREVIVLQKKILKKYGKN